MREANARDFGLTLTLARGRVGARRGAERRGPRDREGRLSVAANDGNLEDGVGLEGRESGRAKVDSVTLRCAGASKRKEDN